LRGNHQWRSGPGIVTIAVVAGGERDRTNQAPLPTFLS
jgi:hypothetical protein